uniref:DNA polymerase epsilon subunit 4 n=1 Tax=Cacopsylla melanoneura TaxID=428564 RepID=A0A8D8UTU0_9HEMI
MSSEPILFDSEEMDSQNKENMTHNENITQSQQTKETKIKSTQENPSNQINEQPSNEPSKDLPSENELVESQSSQDILDSIGKHPKQVVGVVASTETLLSKDMNNVSPDILDSQTPVENIDNIVPDKPMDFSETPVENDNNPPIAESMELSENTEANRDSENLNHSNDTSEPRDSELMEETEESLGPVEESQGGEKVLGTKSTSNATMSSDKEWSLPLSRVKMIMKTDPNVNIVSAEAAILAAIAAEHFTKFITRETVRITLAKKKKTLLKNHLDEAIQGLEVTEFLEGMMDD